MKLFALSDPHLSFAHTKPMNVFGKKWDNHAEKIAAAFAAVVGQEDVTLISGDVSWALNLSDALPDLHFLHELPGKKILLRGNHDYWWGTYHKTMEFIRQNGIDSIELLHNNATEAAGFALCGTRGWLLPSDDEFKAQDLRILQRENLRLKLCLKAQQQLLASRPELTPLATTHYPPISKTGEGYDLAATLESSGNKRVVFGHIHHDVPFYRQNPTVNGIQYIIASADVLNFKPLLIGEDGVFSPVNTNAGISTET